MGKAPDLRGQPLAKAIEKTVATEVKALVADGITPCISVVIASDESSVYSYAQLKKTADALGVKLDVVDFGKDATQQDLESMLDDLSADRRVHGIALDLPLSAKLNADRALSHITPHKDVDGLTATNLGLVAAGREDEAILAATAQACIELAQAQGSLEGKQVGVVGRGRTVGRPLISMLINRHATVTVCHSRTDNMAKALAPCDIVIVAVGKPNVIRGRHLAAGQIVIDAGINIVGKALVGDVELESAKQKVAGISPVVGGVSPLASAIIFRNLLRAIQLQRSTTRTQYVSMNPPRPISRRGASAATG